MAGLKGLEFWTVVELPKPAPHSGPGDFKQLQRYHSKDPGDLVLPIFYRFPMNKSLPKEAAGLAPSTDPSQHWIPNSELLPTDPALQERYKEEAIRASSRVRIDKAREIETKARELQDAKVIADEQEALAYRFAQARARTRAQEALHQAARFLTMDRRAVTLALRLHRIDELHDHNDRVREKNLNRLGHHSLPLGSIARADRDLSDLITRRNDEKGAALSKTMASLKTYIDAQALAAVLHFNRAPLAQERDVEPIQAHANNADVVTPISVGKTFVGRKG